MARLARIRLAGTIAATVLCAAAATEAAAQDGSVVLNNQLQLGDVVAGQTLNVVDADDQVTASTSAWGNTVAGTVQNDSLALRSTQDMRGDATATLDMALGGDTGGAVSASVQAGGNYLAGGAYDADLAIDATQTVDAGQIVATSSLPGGTARLLEGADVGVSATANAVALGGASGRLDGTINQSSDAGVRSENYAATQYLPARADFRSQSVANTVSAVSNGVSDQDLSVRQRSTGALIQAGTSANAGNAWDLAGRAQAVANQASFINDGGAQVTAADQGNASQVRATAIVTAWDFGAATAHARAAGNEVRAGNSDIYVEIDNTQLNSGGVAADASFAGTNGYDAYVGADAVGNAVTAYGCSECAGELLATNDQTNSGAVTATTTTAIAGSGRAAVTGANAVGNAATFYVTRSGQ